jgi:nucleolin
MDCAVMTNMTGKSRGFAIVTFNSQEQADRAIAEMQNKELAGRPIEVNYSSTIT